MRADLRRFDARDLNAVADLLNSVLPDTQPHNDARTSLTRKLNHDGLMFVAEVDGKICGFVMAGYDGHRGWLYQLAVLPDVRRLGIGRALVEQAVSALKQLGCPKINLQVRADNTEVVAFYQSLGFTLEHRVSMGMVTETGG